MSETAGSRQLIESIILGEAALVAWSSEKKGYANVMFDPDRILDQILEIFVEYDNWLTFRQLAYRITGDPSNEHVIAEIVHRHSRVLIVNDGCRCRLRGEKIVEDAAQIAPLP